MSQDLFENTKLISDLITESNDLIEMYERFNVQFQAKIATLKVKNKNLSELLHVFSSQTQKKQRSNIENDNLVSNNNNNDELISENLSVSLSESEFKINLNTNDANETVSSDSCDEIKVVEVKSNKKNQMKSGENDDVDKKKSSKVNTHESKSNLTEKLISTRSKAKTKAFISNSMLSPSSDGTDIEPNDFKIKLNRRLTHSTSESENESEISDLGIKFISKKQKNNKRKAVATFSNSSIHINQPKSKVMRKEDLEKKLKLKFKIVDCKVSLQRLTQSEIETYTIKNNNSIISTNEFDDHEKIDEAKNLSSDKENQMWELIDENDESIVAKKSTKKKVLKTNGKTNGGKTKIR